MKLIYKDKFRRKSCVIKEMFNEKENYYSPLFKLNYYNFEGIYRVYYYAVFTQLDNFYLERIIVIKI